MVFTAPVAHTALSVAGSDSSGGAGIQADLNTFSRIGVYGMSVIAALTAQNTMRVSAVLDVPPDFVGLQWDAVMSDIPVGAVKTGMLGTASNIEMTAQKIQQYSVKNVVVDPVMVSTSGTTLLAADAIETLKRHLLPLALLVTPNIDEAAILTGVSMLDMENMELAARQLRNMGPRFVLIKGGHMKGAMEEGSDVVDVLFDGSEFFYFRAARIKTIGNDEVHGTGCVLSAAITAYLALGSSVVDAVQRGKDFVTEAIATAIPVGSGARPCNASGLKS